MGHLKFEKEPQLFEHCGFFFYVECPVIPEEMAPREPPKKKKKKKQIHIISSPDEKESLSLSQQ